MSSSQTNNPHVTRSYTLAAKKLGVEFHNMPLGYHYLDGFNCRVDVYADQVRFIGSDNEAYVIETREITVDEVIEGFKKVRK